MEDKLDSEIFGETIEEWRVVWFLNNPPYEKHKTGPEESMRKLFKQQREEGTAPILERRTVSYRPWLTVESGR